MKPPYEITSGILTLVRSISEKIGEVNANYLQKQSPQLRKRNKVRTIHSSLQIEGNTLTEEQITALIEHKRVAGPKKDILEVLNAIKVYDNLEKFIPVSERSFLSGHRLLMSGLMADPGTYRRQGVGIAKGNKIEHIAPQAKNVRHLMAQLFNYLKDDKELTLIKSCVFHYEMEFIHPFLDGNGRTGRLWQTVILMSEYPVFEFLPFETLISKTQKEYYNALSLSDRSGNSTPFIEYMLNVIDGSLAELLNYNNRVLTDLDRIQYFIQFEKKEFTRKDYMNVFKTISTATASRDLQKAVTLKYISKKGTLNKTKYRIRK